MNNNTFIYEGKVTTKLKNRNGDIISHNHNDGTNLLFKFLCNCLISRFNRFKAPTWLDIGTIEDGHTIEDFNSILKSSKPPLTGGVVVNTTNEGDTLYSTMFTSTVLYEDINNSADNNLNEKYAVILNNDNEILAYSKIVGDNLSMTEGTELIVEWTMNIQNIESNNASGGNS